jgi:hypothetical protein
VRVGDLVQYKNVGVNFLGIVVEELDSHQVSVCFVWDKKVYTNQVPRRDLKVVSSNKKQNGSQ